ncbi:PREDICTED: CDC42 small effector protein 1 isoform X1 [Hipposideros armiger]|uniref:CDC42 small effector protein 1 isoform X1 n=1 Tax=Hipposideros armiger TaxID=186990 RepID=A0A8B7PWH5_HIPAR|nr:PREDICTED: CDC42 small effector protein 1 isoform X1 [Hipposideros armiger]
MEGGRRGCGACSGLERQQWGLRRLCLLAASPSPSPVSESVGSASPCNAAPPKTGGRTPRPSLPDSANSNDRFQSPLGREPRGRHLRRLTGLHSNCPALQRARADWGCSERAANCPLSPTSAGPPSAPPPRRGAIPGTPHWRARSGSPPPATAGRLDVGAEQGSTAEEDIALGPPAPPSGLGLRH